jgi:hypothetical protein
MESCQQLLMTVGSIAENPMLLKVLVEVGVEDPPHCWVTDGPLGPEECQSHLSDVADNPLIVFLVEANYIGLGSLHSVPGGPFCIEEIPGDNGDILDCHHALRVFLEDGPGPEPHVVG